MTTDHYTLERATSVRATVCAATGLHIGCGKEIGVGSTDAPVLRDARGWPYVPGSSFRGVLRSGIESVLRAVDARETGLRACDPLEEPCFDLRKIDRDRRRGAALAASFAETACTACQLFGASGFASRVRVRDLHSKQPGTTTVRDGVGIDRELRTARAGVKYDYELLEPGTGFDLGIEARNLDDWQLGLLAMGLGLIDDGHLSVGGLGSRGLGRVTLHITGVRDLDARALLADPSAAFGDRQGSPRDALAPWLDALQRRSGAGGA